jgi:hypothetical protein
MVFDSTLQKTVSVLTVTDFIHLVTMFYQKYSIDEALEELDGLQLASLPAKPLVTIGPDATLFDGICG